MRVFVETFQILHAEILQTLLGIYLVRTVDTQHDYVVDRPKMSLIVGFVRTTAGPSIFQLEFLGMNVVVEQEIVIATDLASSAGSLIGHPPNIRREVLGHF